jgi:hypothetical protein
MPTAAMDFSTTSEIASAVARGLAYGVGSGAVSLLLLWAQSGGWGN